MSISLSHKTINLRLRMWIIPLLDLSREKWLIWRQHYLILQAHKCIHFITFEEIQLQDASKLRLTLSQETGISYVSLRKHVFLTLLDPVKTLILSVSVLLCSHKSCFLHDITRKDDFLIIETLWLEPYMLLLVFIVLKVIHLYIKNSFKNSKHPLNSPS